jgi:ribosome modulation factor
MDRAVKEPEGFLSWNPAMRGAYRKGYEAATAGKTAGACPYEDKRKDCGRLTWSRAFRAAWHDGWDAARQADPLRTHYADRANSGLAALAR